MLLLSHVQLFVTPDCSPPGSFVPGILQARILEWVAVPSSRGSPQPRTEPRSPVLQADSLPAEPPGKLAYKFFFYFYWRETLTSRKKTLEESAKETYSISFLPCIYFPTDCLLWKPRTALLCPVLFPQVYHSLLKMLQKLGF